MGVDFSKLVLSPAMATFAKPVTVTPLASQPNAAPYSARGIWSVQSTSILGESGNIFSTVNLKFGVRFGDYPVELPAQGDLISSKAADLPLGYWQGQIDPTVGIDFIIDNVTPDGQGGAVIDVKRVVA
jgi:hypothetical protein